MSAESHNDSVSAGVFGIGMASYVEITHAMMTAWDKLVLPALIAFLCGAAYKLGAVIIDALAVAWAKRMMRP